jgi:hypothetical protein
MTEVLLSKIILETDLFLPDSSARSTVIIIIVKQQHHYHCAGRKDIKLGPLFGTEAE